MGVCVGASAWVRGREKEGWVDIHFACQPPRVHGFRRLTHVHLGMHAIGFHAQYYNIHGMAVNLPAVTGMQARRHS